VGWDEHELGAHLAALIREGTSQHVWQVFAPWPRSMSRSSCPELKVPTLVLHSRQGRILPVDVAMGIAGRIPDARLALLGGTPDAVRR
jgi:pimeloyl-ACP methyl ester carboxylesterase